eukprot:4220815-Alexandrium_andersonii.AAC.1
MAPPGLSRRWRALSAASKFGRSASWTPADSGEQYLHPPRPARRCPAVPPARRLALTPRPTWSPEAERPLPPGPRQR